MVFAQTAATLAPADAGAASPVTSAGVFGQTPFLHAAASTTVGHA
jgi:hypothetical protein